MPGLVDITAGAAGTAGVGLSALSACLTGAGAGTVGAGDGIGAGTVAAGRLAGLPASGAFGSQLLLRSASAASCSALRCGTLLTKGTGVLVTYSATPSASASPINRPTIMPSTKPPRCVFMHSPFHGSFVQGR